MEVNKFLSLRTLRLCGEIVFLFLLIFLFACGYQLVGKETHVPSGMTSLAIPTFVNKTLEPGIEIQFTEAFLQDFIFDRRVKILDRDAADSTLEGVIKSFSIQSVSYDRSGQVLEYQTNIVVDLVLKKRTGEIVWKEMNLSETQWYRALSIGVLNETSKAIAVQSMARLVAQRVRNRLFYNF
jgi:outer membrane lipopolysaccharide assembly protein LptE/RlpB